MTTPPNRCVLRSAVLYAFGYPHATAVIVEDGVISWVGDDEALDALALRGDTEIDCGGYFLAPAFFDAGTADTALRDSVGGALTVAPDRVLLFRDRTGATVSRDVESAELDPNVTVANSLSPSGPIAYASDLCGDDPWAWIARQVDEGHASVRSAFTATTRAGWRLVGSQTGGTIAPGEVARLCLWQCEVALNHHHDERISRWSTDPRSGTAPLPAISSSAPMPQLTLTVFGNAVRRYTDA